MASNWTPETWQSREARHLPVYPDAAALGKAGSSFHPAKAKRPSRKGRKRATPALAIPDSST